MRELDRSSGNCISNADAKRRIDCVPAQGATTLGGSLYFAKEAIEERRVSTNADEE
ncbi:hypothetical protein PSAB6_110237 [Paraburkholderia sabiae]|nr:hypothetical protein PSAB6_110237 [Paraburkholderia sabiae]